MNLLIIKEGNESGKPSASFFDRMTVDKVGVLYLSPSVKAFSYREELQKYIKRETEVEIIDHKKFVDFNRVRKELLDFIAVLPGRFKIGSFYLLEYLTIQGLNMWWTSAVVEATADKRNMFQNLYYLSAAQCVIKKFDIAAVWFDVDDISLEKDLILMLDSAGVKYYSRRKKHHWQGCSSYLRQCQALRWLLAFISQLIYSIVFKIICPDRIRPKKTESGQKSIHAFYGYYPYSIGFNDNVPEAKIYKDLPSVLSKHLGGEAYYLCDLFPRSVFSLRRLIKESRKFWKYNFRFIPMDIFVSIWEILHVFLSPARWWKYFCLKRHLEYRKLFQVGSIDMFHTFDRLIKSSLIGDEARMIFFHYYAFRRFVSRYEKNIFQIVYYLELHNWEVALISGAKAGNRFVPVVGLQQAAPNPISLNFFLLPKIFKNNEDVYLLPDLIACSGQVYRELFLASGIAPERVEIIGHIVGQYLNQICLLSKSKQQRRKELNLSLDRKICLVACSIVSPATEGMICLLRQVVSELPEILFLIKGHPDVPVEPLLRKYVMGKTENVKIARQPVSVLLPLSDCFLSTRTSVSQEALCLSLPQVNLDVSGLPQANPLCLIPGLIQDIDSPEGLLNFFRNTDMFHIPKKNGVLFIGDLNINPCQKFLESVVTRFHS